MGEREFCGPVSGALVTALMSYFDPCKEVFGQGWSLGVRIDSRFFWGVRLVFGEVVERKPFGKRGGR